MDYWQESNMSTMYRQERQTIMKYKDTTGKAIQDAFIEFHRKNRKVYDLFVEQVIRAVRLNKTMVSSKAIINWIRWEVSLNINTKDSYKINDAFTPHYARLFMKEYPQYADMFEVRELRDGSEHGTHRINEVYRVDILRNMVKGRRLFKYTNNTVVLMPLANSEPSPDLFSLEPDNVTTVSFNKMVKDKFITVAHKDAHAHEYQITQKGISFIENPSGDK